MVNIMDALTSHSNRMASVVLLVLMLLEEAAIITLGTAVTLVVAIIAIHDGIGPTSRTCVVIHNLRLVILELVEVGHTTTQASDFLAARVVVVLAMLSPF